jgi:hypothetical protein
VIALFLAHPEYAQAVPMAMQSLSSEQIFLLKVFYTAAVLLQRSYEQQFQHHLGQRWKWLPDYFSAELGLPDEIGSPERRLDELGKEHVRVTGRQVNWNGTYTNVARTLVRRWEMEKRWNK